MPKRAGSGRKKGGANLKTRAIADKAAQEGITPLEVMIEAMRTHYFAKRLDEAAAIAKDAAPYMHPRLSTVEVGNKDKEPFQIEQKEYGAELHRRLSMLSSVDGDSLSPPEYDKRH